MKKLKDFTIEAVAAVTDDTMKNFQKSVESLKKQISKILGPDFNVAVSVSTLGGPQRPSVVVEVYGKNPVNKIKHNSPTFSHFWCHDAFSLGPNSVSWESSNSPRVLKFRKINGSDFESVSQKLINWFEKSKSEFKDLEKAGKK